jgi:hypothetical protein
VVLIGCMHLLLMLQKLMAVEVRREIRLINKKGYEQKRHVKDFGV